MAKKTKEIALYKKLGFDSPEEMEFHCWAKEALKHGYIDSVEYHPEAYELTAKASRMMIKQMKTKTKAVEKFLCHPHSYTLDFLIVGNDRFNTLAHNLISMDNKIYYIDIKGGFSIYNNHREFSINRKLLFQKYGIYVNDVTPKQFFKTTFCPVACALTEKNGKPRKHYRDMPTVFEALKDTAVKCPPIEWV